MIDIKGSAADPRAARLSNFTDRTFVFDGVACAGLEGLLQSFKCCDPEIQLEICALKGREAKRRGREYDHWKETQLLWWQYQLFPRCSRRYHELVTRVYDTVYSQDESFKVDLLAVGYEDICHSIGNTDMRETVLTEVEMIYQLNRLRIRALRDRQ